MRKITKIPDHDKDGNICGYILKDEKTGEVVGWEERNPATEVPPKDRVNVPHYAKDGTLIGYNVTERKTGKILGWIGPDHEEYLKQTIIGMSSMTGFDEALDSLVEEKAQAGMGADLKAIKEKLVNVSANDRMNIPETASYLRVSVGTVRRRIKDGSLRAMKMGGAYQFRRSDLDVYLESSRKIASPSTPSTGKSGAKRKPNYDKIARSMSLGGRRNS